MSPTEALSEELIGLLEDKAFMIRRQVIALAEIAKNGHYVSAFSMAEILAVLYYSYLRIRPTEPDWHDRDRFVLSKGHAVIALYPVLADLGFFSDAVLSEYTGPKGVIGDHPRVGSVPGIDSTTGSLGHGLSLSVGMALGLRIKGSPARVVCMLGDGELAEGQVWEAIMSAAHHRLGNLVAVVDINAVGSGSATADAMNTEPLVEKWSAFGWHVTEVPNGHDVVALHRALSSAAQGSIGMPTVVLARTVAGKGVSFMEGTWEWHLGYLGDRDRAIALADLDTGNMGRYRD